MALNYTYLKYKDTYTLKNNGSVTLTYSVSKVTCEATTEIKTGTILPGQTTALNFIVDGNYSVYLASPTQVGIPFIIKHYYNLLTSFISMVEGTICGCSKCSDCEECNKCDDYLGAFMKAQAFAAVNHPVYEGYMTQITQDSICVFTEEVLCNLLHEKVYGNANVKDVMLKLIGFYYLSFYYEDKFLAADVEEESYITTKYKFDKVASCMRKLGIIPTDPLYMTTTTTQPPVTTLPPTTTTVVPTTTTVAPITTTTAPVTTTTNSNLCALAGNAVLIVPTTTTTVAPTSTTIAPTTTTTVSPTTTTLAPTTTTTDAPLIMCYSYSLYGINPGIAYWTNCNGTPGSQSINASQTFVIPCAQQGTVVWSGGITQLGLCATTTTTTTSTPGGGTFHISNSTSSTNCPSGISTFPITIYSPSSILAIGSEVFNDPGYVNHFSGDNTWYYVSANLGYQISTGGVIVAINDCLAQMM